MSSRAWPRAVVFRRRRRVGRSRLADYYLNGYWYDSAYLRVVHHGANSTVVILISDFARPLAWSPALPTPSPLPTTAFSVTVPPAASPHTCTAANPGIALSPSRFHPLPSPLRSLSLALCSSGTTRRINVCFQDFWLSAE